VLQRLRARYAAALGYVSDRENRGLGFFQAAEDLIRAGKAYVDDQSQDEIRANRGTLTEPGKNSAFRDRSVEENLDLFRRMRAGELSEDDLVFTVDAATTGRRSGKRCVKATKKNRAFIAWVTPISRTRPRSSQIAYLLKLPP